MIVSIKEIMQDLLKAQTVAKRPRFASLPERPSLLAKADSARRNTPRTVENHIRPASWLRTHPGVRRGILVTSLVCALSPFALLPFLFALNVVPDNLTLDLGGNGGSLNQRAMLAYAGLDGRELEHIDSGDGFTLDISETFRADPYKVSKGDTVSTIAARNNLSIDSIISLNKLANVKRLYAGQTIRIPNMDGIAHTVKKGETLGLIAKAQGVPIEAILDANDLDTDVLTVGMSLFIPGAKMRRDELKMAMGEFFIRPIPGRLTSGFGWRNDPFTGQRSFHNGIDISARTGTAVKAGMDGRVSSLGTNGVFGNYVIISHSGGYQTLYAHLHTRSVKKGQYVLQGHVIGGVGSTGRSTGPHLHFSVYRNGRAIDPMQFIAR